MMMMMIMMIMMIKTATMTISSDDKKMIKIMMPMLIRAIIAAG